MDFIGGAAWFFDFKKMCKIRSKKLEKCEKNKKKVGKMCENQFEKLEKCVMLLVLRLEGGGFQ